MVTGRYLGIDMGGTATRWVAVDESGEIAARGAVDGATGHLFNPAERERFAGAIAAIAAAAGAVDAVYAGITGFGPGALGDVRGIVGKAWGLAPKAIGASDDIELAYLSVFARGAGHLIAAGTGSIGLHVPETGPPVRVGGRGILIDDGGSGSWIALRAIDRLYRRIDESGGPAGAERLAEALAQAVGGADWSDMRSFVYGGDRGRIATLARAVGAAAGSGDPLAEAVLADAGSELARLARALIGRTRPLPVAVIGGVVDVNPSIARGIEAALPGIAVSYPRVDAALTAARIARALAAR